MKTAKFVVLFGGRLRGKGGEWISNKEWEIGNGKYSDSKSNPGRPSYCSGETNNCDVLLLDSSIAGFSIYYDDLIHLMMVDVSLHRNGYGSILLAHTETQLLNG